MFSIQKRWQEHLRDADINRCEKRPLYAAIHKYGKENFIIEEIEQCSDCIVNEREQYWINKYDSYHNGYNATLGGDGKHYVDYDLVCNLYQKLQNRTAVAKELGIHRDTVTNILTQRNISFLDSQTVSKKKFSKSVKQISLNDEIIQLFTSINDAARFLIDSGITNSKLSTVSSHISEVCRGKRKTAYGFKWEND